MTGAAPADEAAHPSADDLSFSLLHVAAARGTEIKRTLLA